MKTVTEAEPAAFTFVDGSTPLIIGTPHLGTHIPPAIAENYTEAALEQPDMAWHVDRLCEFASQIGAARIGSTVSRYVVDLNRSPDGLNRFAGVNNTTLCTLERFDAKAVYCPGKEPDAAEVARRVAAYWTPYHRKLAETMQARRAAFGCAVLLDIHTIPSRIDRFYDDRSPEISLKSGGGSKAAPELVAMLKADLADAGTFSFEVDGTYKGGFIVQEYGDPGRGMHSLQIEISQSLYMDERDRRFRPASAAAVTQLLRRLARTITDWSTRRGRNPSGVEWNIS